MVARNTKKRRYSNNGAFGRSPYAKYMAVQLASLYGRDLARVVTLIEAIEIALGEALDKRGVKRPTHLEFYDRDEDPNG